MYKIGIDTGGTNTDLVLTNIENGKIYSTKTPTTPDNLIEGIFIGINKITDMAGIEPKYIKELIYGTTIVVNMIAQKENVSVALITTKGFKDVLEIGRAWRDKNIYDTFMDKPEPLVSRDLRFEIDERVDFNGNVITELNMVELKKITEQIKKKNVRSVAVCLLHSYRNPEHEELIKEYIKREIPDIFISTSTEINKQFREYERTSTTTINAYMMPNMVTHINEFNSELKEKEISPKSYMMNSNAGIMRFESGISKPVMVSDSGPIGGIIAANYLGEIMNEANLITFDMGGTSCDVSVIKNNKISFKSNSHIEGYPINIPTVDLNFIGAGGGSIAWCDKGGALKVGPKSAGAQPGPVCYQRGGTKPTVTDANLVLGRIRPEMFLEDLSDVLIKTEESIKENISKPLGLSVAEAAEGIIDVVNANMIRVIKVVTVQKGYHPRDFSMVSFGGAGGLHAARIAAELEIPKVIIPYSPGTFAAMGQILADIKHDFVYTELQSSEYINIDKLNSIYSSLDLEGKNQLEAEGVNLSEQILVRSCDIRYLGQAFELNVKVPGGKITNEVTDNLIEEFHILHEKTYGHSLREDQVELVNFRVSAIGIKSKLDLSIDNSWDTALMANEDNLGKVIFDGTEYTVPIFTRNALEPGFRMEGPAIIGEMGSTTVIYPGQSAEIDQFRSIIIYTNL